MCGCGRSAGGCFLSDGLIRMSDEHGQPGLLHRLGADCRPQHTGTNQTYTHITLLVPTEQSKEVVGPRVNMKVSIQGQGCRKPWFSESIQVTTTTECMVPGKPLYKAEPASSYPPHSACCPAGKR